MPDNIEILGIETNNLKNIDVNIVKDGINLILGPSGSGKSSLAYDTIAQIGQYEFMSMFADNYVEPHYRVKSYKNMLAAVPIKQTNFNNNMRSTIGTYFGLNKSIALIYSVITGADRECFVLNKEQNLCPKCHGLGFVKELDLNRILSYNVPLNNNPFKCWDKYKDFYSQIIVNFCNDEGIDSNKTFKQLSAIEQHKLLYGESTKKYSIKYKKVNRIASRTTKYYGVYTENSMMTGFSVNKKYFGDIVCSECSGRRYSKENEIYQIENKSIGEFMITPFTELNSLLSNLIKKCKDDRLLFSLKSLSSFVSMAVENNLGHLYLNRSIPTLSGGELQRLRLVQVFNTQLSNLLIVLDEPLAGISGVEKKNIYNNVVKLAKKHTLIVVDHSDMFVKASKNIIALGDKGGSQGGRLIDVEQYLKVFNSEYSFKTNMPSRYSEAIVNGTVYNYSGIKLKYGVNALNLIYGKSGIGKSTMLREYFPQAFDKYSYVNQKPLLGNKTSSVATLLDIFVKMTDLFSKKCNRPRTYFSNQIGCEGACPICGGAGYLEYGNDVDSKTIISCKDCEGTGFNIQLKKYKIREKNIFDIWNMTINEGIDYFKTIDSSICEKLTSASELLLGHLKIGQPSTTLSGGENIRIKLIKELKSKADVIGVDEPYKGLGPDEIYAVTVYLEKLRAQGKTVFVVDHTESAFGYFPVKTELIVKDSYIVG